MTTLQANLDALMAATGIALEATASGDVKVDTLGPQPSVSVLAPDARWVSLHSRRDPSTEADRLVKAAFSDAEPDLLIVIGLGLGYILDAVERRSSRTKVLAFEPLAGTLVAMFERRDWSEWISSGRLVLLYGPDFVGASDTWKLVDGCAKAPVIIVHPVLKREFSSETDAAHALARSAISGAQANAAARRRFAGQYLLNTLENLPVICSEGDVSTLLESFSGFPAIVIGAGPSLDNSLGELRKTKDRALLISVDTAVRPLLAARIRPHVIVAVDPQRPSALHLTDVADGRGTWLVAEGSLDPSVWRPFVGHTFNFKVSDHHPWPWFRAHGTDRGTLQAWGSVLTSAFDLACHVGCDPVVLVGADLAHTDGLGYCQRTIYTNERSDLLTVTARANEFAECLRREHRPTCEETDIRGNPVTSTPHFVQFRDWLVSRSVAVSPRRVVNATGAGILHGGSITQAKVVSWALPAPAGTIDVDARLAWAWEESAESRTQSRVQMQQAFTDQGDPGVPMDAWLEFAGDTASQAQISASLATALRGLET